MKYYIVTWVLFKTILQPCPNTKDEFGRTVSHYYDDCSTTKTDTLSKEFSNRKEAFEFYNKGRGQFDSDSTFLLAGQEHLTYIKIDSAHYVDTDTVRQWFRVTNGRRENTNKNNGK